MSHRPLVVAALLASAGVAQAFPPNVRAVNPVAAPGGNGTSWAQAYNSLQAAIDEALSNGTITEIWLAQGDHRPTREQTTGVPESRSFVIPDGVAIYGGFTGDEETLPERDTFANPTVLSGATLTPPPRHVVVIQGAGPATMLDGVQISGGISAGPLIEHQRGGGLLIVSGTPTLVDCTISANQGMSGAGVAVLGGSPEFIGCRIKQNSTSSAAIGGAGLLVMGGSVSLRQCTVQQNSATGPVAGGGIAIYGGGAVVMDRTHVIQNTADTGGGLYCGAGSFTATNSMFRGNAGGIAGQNLSLTNCTIINNVPVKLGTWAGVNGTGVMRNSIVWGNREAWAAGIVPQVWGGMIVSYSCVEPNSTGPQLAGEGLLRSDPLLDSSGCPSHHSRCIDSGLTTALAPGLTLDLLNRPRLLDDIGTPNAGPGGTPVLDMGALEFQGTTCYANCDQSTAEPRLSISDFSCFISRFAAGDPMANCDESVEVPRLNVGDFTCFLSRFSQGCP